MRTKPFDLEKALAGHPVVTRSGEPVNYLHHFPTPSGSLVGVRLGMANVSIWYSDGRYLGAPHPFDLFLVVKTAKRWARVLRKDRTRVAEFFGGFESKEEAERPTTERDLEVLPSYEYEIDEL